MRSLFIISAILFLASCGNQKIRFVRAPIFKKQAIVEVETIQSETKENKIAEVRTKDGNSHSTVSEKKAISAPKTTEFYSEDRESNNQDFHSTNDLEEFETFLPSMKEDTLTGNEGETQESTAIALEAEKLATIGMWLNRIGMFLVLLSLVLVVMFLGWEILLAAMGIAVGLSITAIVLGFISKGKAYNTKLGSQRSSKAIIAGFSISLILGLGLLLVAGLI